MSPLIPASHTVQNLYTSHSLVSARQIWNLTVVKDSGRFRFHWKTAKAYFESNRVFIATSSFKEYTEIVEIKQTGECVVQPGGPNLETVHTLVRGNEIMASIAVCITPFAHSSLSSCTQ